MPEQISLWLFEGQRHIAVHCNCDFPFWFAVDICRDFLPFLCFREGRYYGVQRKQIFVLFVGPSEGFGNIQFSGRLRLNR
jgi:hypothetical protein